MGSIYKDGNAYRAAVQVGFDSVTGKPRHRKIRCSSHDEAVAELKRLTGDQTAGRLEAANGLTVSTYFAHWLGAKIRPLRAPAAHRQYSWLFSNHIEPHLGKKRLDKVGQPDVQRLIDTKVGQKVSPRDKGRKNQPTQTLSRNA